MSTLLASEVGAESGGNIHAVSRTGAQGTMQSTPEPRRQGVTDSFHADQTSTVDGLLDALVLRFTIIWPWRWPPTTPGRPRSTKNHGVPPIARPKLRCPSHWGVQP